MKTQNKLILKNSQNGVATILMVVLIGFGIAASALAIMFSVQNTQSKQIAAQAQVHSQAAVWTAAEAMRIYLSQLEVADVAKLTSTGDKAEFPAALLGDKVTVRPRLEVLPQTVAATGTDPEHKRLTMLLTAIDKEARSSSSIEVVYDLYPGDTGVVDVTDSAVFEKGLKTGGNITAVGDRTNKVTYTVNDGEGQFSGKMTGVEIVRATGNLSLANDTDIDEAYSNGNVTISGAGKIRVKVEAIGDITTGGADCIVGSAYANGNINLECQSAGIVKEVLAGGNITVVSKPGVHYQTIATKSTSTTSVLIKGNCNTASCFDKIESLGNVGITATNSGISKIRSGGALNCNSPAADQFFVLSLGSALAKSFVNCPNVTTPTKYSTAASITLETTIRTITPWSLAPLEINVWKSAGEANYVISKNASDQTEVFVKNVNGIPSDTYVLGKDNTSSSPSKRYLCLKSTLGSQTDPSCAPAYKFCHASAAETQCINQENDGFAINGTVVPGAMFFVGNLNLKGDNGPYQITASLLASGNIQTNDNVQVAALNFAGKSGLTVALPSGIVTENAAARTVGGVCTNLSGTGLTLTPSNYCAAGEFISEGTTLGNIGLMAGGRKPTTDPDVVEAYSGGNIRLGAQNKVFGSVLAGNFLKTEGRTWIKGYITASGLLPIPVGTTPVAGPKNDLGSDTLQDLGNLPATFKPNSVPSGNGGTGVAGKPAKITGSRYR